jgi:hypothetical protein
MNVDQQVWHDLFSASLIVVITLTGFTYNTIKSSLKDIKQSQEENEIRHREFVAGLLGLSIELHPEKAEIISRVFKELLQ